MNSASERAAMTKKRTDDPFGETDPLRRCGARCPTRGGRPCLRWRIHGNVRCGLHGGLKPSIHGFRTFAWSQFRKRRKAELRADWPGASIRIVPAEGFGNRRQPNPEIDRKPMSSVVDVITRNYVTPREGAE